METLTGVKRDAFVRLQPNQLNHFGARELVLA
jgi:hypothetical protein